MRKFPSYTTAMLKESVARGVTEANDAANIAAIVEEIKAREAGTSRRSPTPPDRLVRK